MSQNRPANLHIAFVAPILGLNSRRILHGIFRYTSEHPSWRLRIALDATDKVLPDLKKAGIDGAFLSTPTKKIMSMAQASKIPCIAFQCMAASEVLPYLTADSTEAGKLAAEHFIERGFRNFVYYGTGELFWSRDRMLGFCQRVEQAGFTVGVYTMPKKLRAGAGTIWRPEPAWMQDIGKTVKWLRDLPKPVALMACDDHIAYDLVELAEETGIRVPEEISIVGVYNDETVCLAANPPLSSVAIDLENAGYEAAGLLNDIIEGKVGMEGQPVYAAATHVVTRQSSDILAIDDAEVSAAVHCIRTKFNSPLMVADVVKAAGSSRRRLQLKFRKILKRSITREILRVRIEHIARMLLESHMSIDALAASSAFDSTSHMIRVFKQYKGVPPRTFRKMHGAI